MKTEADMTETRPEAQGHLEPQTLEEARRTLPCSPRREPSPAPPGSQTLVSRAGRGWIPVGLSPVPHHVWSFIAAAPGPS